MAKAKKTRTPAEKAADSAKNGNATKPVDDRPIPEFRDKDEQLKKLKASDFPKTKEGKLAYCDYNLERWKDKRKAVEKGLDPKAKKMKRREKLLAQLAALDEELTTLEK